MSFILFLLVLGATWRLARLAAVDEIARVPRDWLAARSTWLAYLVTCPWCVSVWIGPVVAWAAIYYGDNRVVLVALLALTASGVAGMMQVVEDRLDR